MSHTFRVQNGDIFYTNNGYPAFTQTSQEKVNQDLSECTIVPTNDIGFGFGLSSLEDTVEDPDSMPALIESLITDGITRFISLQQQNQRLIRDDYELIQTLASVQANFVAPGNYTDYNFAYAVNSVAGSTVGASPLTTAGTVSV